MGKIYECLDLIVAASMKCIFVSLEMSSFCSLIAANRIVSMLSYLSIIRVTVYFYALMRRNKAVSVML